MYLFGGKLQSMHCSFKYLEQCTYGASLYHINNWYVSFRFSFSTLSEKQTFSKEEMQEHVSNFKMILRSFLLRTFSFSIWREDQTREEGMK